MFKREENGSSFSFTFEGNEVYGFMRTEKEYVIVGASFNGAQYTKYQPYDKNVGWKRDKRGGLSKVFCKWVEAAEKELYTDFYNLKGGLVK